MDECKPLLLGSCVDHAKLKTKVRRLYDIANILSSLRQGLTLVHFSAKPEPFLTHNTPESPNTRPKHPLNTP